MTPLEFLNALFEYKNDDQYILVWRLQSKKSKFFTDIKKAAEYIIANPNDIYVGTGLRPKNFGPKRRGTIEEVSGYVGLFADIDVKNPHHASPNAPPSINDAIKTVKGYGFDPSLIVCSGYGVHAYWLFKEPEMFETNEERNASSGLLRRMYATIMARLQKNGWSTENTFELTRILRPTGSFNCKDPTNPVKVDVIEFNDTRYNPEDFDELLETSSVVTNKAPIKIIQTTSQSITFDAAANPPAGKLVDIMNIFAPKFTETWEHDRSDLKDKSPSGYDFALALFAVKAGWSNQEIADLMIACRRKNECDLKLSNQQYYIRSILQARKFIEESATEEALETITLAQGTEFENATDKSNQRKILNKLIGVDIIEILKFMREPPEYVFHINNGGKKKRLPIKKPDEINSKTAFSNHIFGCINRPMNPLSTKQWHQAKTIIGKLIKEVDVGEEVTSLGNIIKRIRQFIDSSEAITIEEKQYRLGAFVHNGHWHLKVDDLHTWIRTKTGDKLDQNDILVRMKELGCTCMRYWIPSLKKQDRSWKIPKSIAPARPDLKVINNQDQTYKDTQSVITSPEPINLDQQKQCENNETPKEITNQGEAEAIWQAQNSDT